VRKNTIKALLIAISLLLVNGVTAQITASNVDQRLVDVYGQTRVDQLAAEQPQFLEYMNYYIQNGYQIMYDVPERKLPYFDDISTISNNRTGKPITPSDIDNLNILLLDIHRKHDEYLTYKVGETGTVVIFIAPKNLLQEYQQMKKMGGQR